MAGWLESVAGPEYANALMWTIFALIGLLVLLVLVRIVRSFTFGTFIAGGRNRKARLAVMDATAVDSHRRLVLVRRDDVEHLILIGGPSDVVVEQGIKLQTPVRRPAEDAHAPAMEERRPAPPPSAPVVPPRPPAAPVTEPPAARVPAAQPAAAVSQPSVRPSHKPIAETHPDPVLAVSATVQRPVPERPAPVNGPAVAPPRAPSPPPQQSRFSTIAAAAPGQGSSPPTVQTAAAPDPALITLAPAVAPPASYATMRPVAPAAPLEPAPAKDLSAENLDDALLQELQESLDREPGHPHNSSPERERALEEEMSRLLGDLTAKR